RARLKGHIVNRFRGDPALFDDALPLIAQRTGMPSLGVVPWLDATRDLPAEDTASLGSRYVAGDWGRAPVRIAVPRLARIANFDDLDPLAAEPDVALRLVEPGESLPGDANLILLAGSKSTRTDMDELRRNGWVEEIRVAAEGGAHVFGLCGGYQMLGRTISDPSGTEGPAGTTPGLGLLDVETRIAVEKTLSPAAGRTAAEDIHVTGFEMHMGETAGPDTQRPFLALDGGRPDGATDGTGRIAGTYLHGLFGTDAFRAAFLRRIDCRASATIEWNHRVDVALDRLADHMDVHLDTRRILEIAHERGKE
ncbi:MAG: cobyric acid synthase, partial [Alphaproteobacteria bacterium]|nr:cobyric acid synthase [Alphaproteobacteria bacterium]